MSYRFFVILFFRLHDPTTSQTHTPSSPLSLPDAPPIAEDVGRYFRARSRNRRLNRDDLSEQAVRGEGRHFQVKDLSRLVSTLRTIRSQTPGSRLDLNQSNFMLRKTPQGKALVITDPLA